MAFGSRSRRPGSRMLPNTPFPTCRLPCPGGPDGCPCRLLPRPYEPSPVGRWVGVHICPFEACSEFTHVTACRVARPPKAAFVTRLRPGGLLRRAARQLLNPIDNCSGGFFLHGVVEPFMPHARLQQFGGSKTATPLIFLESAFQGRHYTGYPGLRRGKRLAR